MNQLFPKLAMSEYSDSFKNLTLTPLHATNPEPFSQVELEQLVGLTFADILQEVPLGFCADAGSLKLRESIARNLYMKTNAEEIVTHAGAQEALFCVFQALLNPSDKVLVVTPAFEALLQMPKALGCQVSYIELEAKNDWKLDLNELEHQFKLGCKLFVMNFPHNPTGAQLSNHELVQIVDLCDKYDVWLLSDEVFRGLEHSPDIKLPAIADVYHKGISVGVISKALAIPGIRVGWMCCQNESLRIRVLEIKGYLSICNSQLDELLASELLNHPDKILQRNLDLILHNKKYLSQLKTIKGQQVKVITPNAGCSAFVLAEDSTALAKSLANDDGFLLYPAYLFKSSKQALRMGFGYKDFQQRLELIQ